ncbi:MAG: DMT family transporter [Dehalococcoidia bacterium]|nr:DMT family transporter [Dehalococcoidia bacterium]
MVDAQPAAEGGERPRAASVEGPQPLTLPATGFALLLAALWGGNAVAIKAGLDDAPPLRLAWMRFVAGGIVTVAWAISTKQSLRPTRPELRPLAGLAALFTAQIAFMNIGQDHTTASHAVVINTTFPLWTGVIAHFFVRGDRLTRGRTIGTLVAYAGVVAVFGQSLGSSGGTALGDALMLCSAALLGARQVYTSLVSQTVSLPKLLITQTIFGIAVFLGMGLLVENEPWVITERLVLSILYQGVVIAGFGFIGNMWLLKHYLPSGVTALSLTTPVWGVILSHFILDEPLGPTLFLGLALVILGSAMAQWSAIRRRPARVPR